MGFLRGRKHSEETKLKIQASLLGRKHSDEHVKNQVRSRAGYRVSDETKAKIRACKIGKPLSPEHRMKISLSLLGHPGLRGKESPCFTHGRRAARNRDYQNPEPCFYCSAQKVERHHRDGNQDNNSKRNIRWLCRRCHMKQHWAQGDFANFKRRTYAVGWRHTVETRQKMSRQHRGHEVSMETRHKLSAAMRGNKSALGHRHSKETKEKMRIAALAREQRKRGGA